jgi:hypothetical protein
VWGEQLCWHVFTVYAIPADALGLHTKAASTADESGERVARELRGTDPKFLRDLLLRVFIPNTAAYTRGEEANAEITYNMLLMMTIASHTALLVPTPAAGTTMSAATTRRNALFSAAAIGFQPTAARANDSDDEFAARLSGARSMLDGSKSTMLESPDRVRFAVAQTMPYLTYKGYRCARIPSPGLQRTQTKDSGGALNSLATPCEMQATYCARATSDACVFLVPLLTSEANR